LIQDRDSFPIVVVDIDNTVVEHFLRISKFYDPETGLVDMEKANSLEEVLNDEIIPGSLEALTRISKDYQLFWLSSRKSNLLDISKSWLLENGFVVDELVLVDKFSDKVPYLKAWNPILFIDDLEYDHFSLKPKRATLMIEELEINSIPFFVFKRNWDQVIKVFYSENN
jgi:hypothetical protein